MHTQYTDNCLMKRWRSWKLIECFCWTLDVFWVVFLLFWTIVWFFWQPVAMKKALGPSAQPGKWHEPINWRRQAINHVKPHASSRRTASQANPKTKVSKNSAKIKTKVSHRTKIEKERQNSSKSDESINPGQLSPINPSDHPTIISFHSTILNSTTS